MIRYDKIDTFNNSVDSRSERKGLQALLRQGTRSPHGHGRRGCCLRRRAQLALYGIGDNSTAGSWMRIYNAGSTNSTSLT